MNSKVKSLLSLMVLGAICSTGVLAATFPLRVDIDVSVKRDSSNIGAGSAGEAKMEMVKCRVKVRKSGGQAYTKPLTAELYVIGRQIQTGYYGVIDVVKKQFTFSKENDNTFEFTTRAYPFGKTTGNVNVGGKFETYLLVIVDDQGKIVDTRSGRVIREKGIEFIRKLGANTLFDRDGNVIGPIDQNHTTFKAGAAAAVSVSEMGD